LFNFFEHFGPSLVVIRACSNEKIKKSKAILEICGNPDTIATSLTLAPWIFAIELTYNVFLNLQRT